MKEVVIKIPENCDPSNLGFATALVDKAQHFTSEDINIRTDDGRYVDLKSIMGVIALNYNRADEISLQIMGEMEEYTAAALKQFIEKLLQLYI